MRKPIIFILIAIACALLVAAGCTSSSGTTLPATTPATPVATTAAAEASPAAGTTTAAAAATTAGETPTWNGTWSTSYSSFESEYTEVISLTQIGSSVTGTYHNGLGTMDATEQDGKITGTWNDSSDSGKSSGFFEFEKSADGKSFTGRWVSSGEGEDALKTTTQFWNGVRV